MRLLERFEALSPTYSNGLTNHLPMMIIALQKLGIDEGDIEFISEEYVGSKHIPDLTDKYYPKSKQEEEYITLTNLYITKINKLGKDEVVKWYLNKAKFALVSGLFHGLIRLSYALMTDSDLLVAQAMAYFDVIYFECDLPYSIKEDERKELDKLVKHRVKTITNFESKSTMKRLEELINNDYIKDNLYSIRGNAEERMLELFLNQYLKTKDFYMLHIITGFHALISLKEYFTNFEEVLDNFFVHGLLFTLIHDYKQEEYDYVPSELKVFENRIPDLRDAHEIKLLFSVLELYKLYHIDDLKKVITSIFM